MVVWLFPKGVHFGEGLGPTVVESEEHSTANDCLVIVARARVRVKEAGLGPEFIGISFFGGLRSSGSNGVPIILVTDGVLEIDQASDSAVGPVIDYFSAFAGGIYLRGPLLPYRMRLLHASNAPQDQPNGLLDQLLRQKALPNSTGGSSTRFEMLAGTWQDVTP